MKAFGISALVLSIVAIFIPIMGVFIAGLSGFLAFFAAGKNLALGLSAVIINIVNILFLSPSLIIVASSQAANTNESSYSTAFGVLISIQVIAIIIFIVVAIKAHLSNEV
tara:strand:+ start:74 stop:403 length:330 start_codon:yes stop_codon:yes gene_type:complete